MRQRYLVGAKLWDTLSRGLFFLICTYRLPLEEAGRFGLLATVIGLLTFGLGYERHIDMQRQVAGRSSSAIRRRMADTLRFFRAHYLIVLPIAMLSASLVGVSGWPLGLATIVVIGEHFSIQAYLAVLLNPRAFPLLMVATAKNSLQLLAVLYLSWREPEALTTLSILQVWAVASVGYVAIAATWWRIWMREPLLLQGDELPAQTLREQYRASVLHFLVGLVAVMALQVDRLVVGFVLDATEVGIYFRNVALAGLALQVFNIASFNRVTPKVYRFAREGQHERALLEVRHEWRRFALVLLGLVVSVLAINALMDDFASRWGVKTTFVVVLTSSVLFRSRADYSGVLLLSMGQDRSIFLNQSAATLLGSLITFVLAHKLGLLGAFLGGSNTQLLYMLLNKRLLQATPSPSNASNA